MKGLTAVLYREYLGSRRYLLVAGIFGLLPLLLPLLPLDRPPGGWSVFMTPLAEGFALCIGIAVALGLGGSMVAGEVANDRITFLLSQPIPTRTIWFGKVTAAWFMAMATFVIALAPTEVLVALGAYPGLVQDEPIFPPALNLAVLAALLLLVLLSHSVVLTIRARSRWFLLDLLGPVLIASAGLSIEWRLQESGDWHFLSVLALVTTGVVAVALAVAGARQLAVGRADLGRGHRTMALVTWSILLPFAAGAELYTRWLVVPDLADLHHVSWIDPAPEGDWMFVHGTTWRGGVGRYNAFLVNTATGANLALPRASAILPRFSGDGSTAIWQEQEERSGETGLRIVVAHLEGSELRTRTLEMDPPRRYDEMAMARDGRKLAAVDRGTVSVWSLETGERLLQARRPLRTGEQPSRIGFLGSKVRVLWSRSWGASASELTLTQLDPQDAELEVVSTRELPIDSKGEVRGDLAGPVFSYRIVGEWRAIVLDSNSLEVLADLTATSSIRLLSDGRLAYLRREQDGPTTLRLAGEGGEEILLLAEHAPGVRWHFDLGWEVEPGKLTLSSRRHAQEEGGDKWSSANWFEVIDLKTAERSKWATWRYSVGFPFDRRSTHSQFPVGSLGTRLFFDEDRHLVRLEPDGSTSRILAVQGLD